MHRPASSLNDCPCYISAATSFMLIALYSTPANANLVTELVSKTFLIRCRTMDGLKVNAGVKLAGSLTTTSRNGNVCLQVKLAKFSETLTEPYIPPCLYTVYYVRYRQRRSVILLKTPCWMASCLAVSIV